MSLSLKALNLEIAGCRACPRLVEWRERVATEKRAAFGNETYWGKPVPGFGDPKARMLILGLAPAAHGGNRTGRVFTGDRSGDWLFASLYRCGFANQATSVHRKDGLKLKDCYVTAAVKCAPPQNKPAPIERDRCFPYLLAELDLLPNLEVVVALGSFGWDAALRAHVGRGRELPKPKPRFGHGVEVDLGPWILLGSYHPSQQNTFTGKLTEAMTDEIFTRARTLLDS